MKERESIEIEVRDGKSLRQWADKRPGVPLEAVSLRASLRLVPHLSEFSSLNLDQRKFDLSATLLACFRLQIAFAAKRHLAGNQFNELINASATEFARQVPKPHQSFFGVKNQERMRDLLIGLAGFSGQWTNRFMQLLPGFDVFNPKDSLKFG